MRAGVFVLKFPLTVGGGINRKDPEKVFPILTTTADEQLQKQRKDHKRGNRLNWPTGREGGCYRNISSNIFRLLYFSRCHFHSSLQWQRLKRFVCRTLVNHLTNSFG